MPYRSLLPQTTAFDLQRGDPKWAQAQIKNEIRSNGLGLEMVSMAQSMLVNQNQKSFSVK